MATNECEFSMANLTLADLDDEIGEQHLAQVQADDAVVETEFFLVGRLVTEKPTKFTFLKDTMASVWRPMKGLNARELQPHLYLFRFFYDKDVARILEDGPWSFEQSLLILKQITPPEDPESVVLDTAGFWVQLHGLPTGYRSEAVLCAMGNFIGRLVKTDERNFDGSMRTFFRIRVSIDVTRPLRKGMKMKKDNGGWVLVEFKYERLPTFCFVCGVIGHGEKFCPKAAREGSPLVEKPFGAGLRAGSRKNFPTAGQRWIAPETTFDHSCWKSPGDVDIQSTTETDTDFVVDFAKTGNNEMVTTSKAIAIIDQKRKRTEDTSTVSEVAMQVDTDSLALSKNLLVAGAGASQARQSL